MLRGPRAGFIMSKVEDRYHEKYHSGSKWNLAQLIDRGVFPTMQGGPHLHAIAGMACAFKFAQTAEFKAYGAQIVKNAAVLAKTLQDGGVRLTTGGTDNHLMLADVASKNRTGLEVQLLLDSANITANKNAIPFDPLPRGETSGVRFGTPAITSRGMKEAETEQIGKWILEIMEKGDEVTGRIKDEVKDLCAQYPLYPHL